MDSHKEGPANSEPVVKKKRFQLIKLEERIAPKMNGKSPNAGGTANTRKCFVW